MSLCSRGDVESLYFKPGISLLQMCFEALGFPINPIGKTIEVLIYRTGVRFDEVGGTFNDLIARPYETVEDYMGTIVTARAWPSKDHVSVRLFITKEGGSNNSNKMELSSLYWLFSIERPEMTLKPLKEKEFNDHYTEVYPLFSDCRITVDNLLDNIKSKTMVVVRVLE